MKNEKINNLSVLKILACLLITNSHCGDFYPLNFLAVGGGHGNSIFFIISGFLLADITLSYGKWLMKRLVRLLPVTVIFLSISAIQNKNQLSVIYLLNRYWFVSAILIFYFIYYFAFKYLDANKLNLLLSVLISLYAIIYTGIVDKTIFSIELSDFSPFKVYFYFIVMVSGGVIRKNIDLIKSVYNKKIQFELIGVVVLSFFLWGAEYACILLYGKGLTVQFLIHLAVLMFAASVIIIAVCTRQIRIPNNQAGKIINLLSNCTLEIYLLQITILSWLKQINVKYKVFIFFAIAIIGGMIIHICYDYTIRTIKSFKKEKFTD